MSQDGVYPKLSKNNTPYGNWNDLKTDLTQHLKQEDGFTYDDGNYKHKVTYSEQYGWTVWGNKSDKKKQDAKQEQKKLVEDERTQKIEQMAKQRDQKFDDLIAAIGTLGTKIDNLAAALEYRNKQVDEGST
jgi:hypothetical protein